jgi:sulfite exporter TauE/SafE
MLAAVTAGATLGLVNLAHCAAMCGPLSSAASHPAGRSGPVRYQLGRLAGYTFVGALSGHLGRVLQLLSPSSATVWVTSALTAGACLLTARSLLAASANANKPAAGLVQLRGARPHRSVFSLLLGLVPKEPVVLGVLSTLLPCGVLASALLAAVASGDGVSGALLMFAFAAVSGIAVWAAGAGAHLAPRRYAQIFRRTFAYALVVLAALTFYRPIHALTRTPQQSAPHSAACH